MDEPKECPKGMKKFNRMAQTCTDCRLGGSLSTNRLGHYKCPYGLEEIDHYIDSEKEGGEGE